MNASVSTGTTNVAPSKGTGRARAWRRVKGGLRWAVVTAVLAVAAVMLIRYRTAHAESAVRYETARVDRGPLAAKVTATGTVSALVTVLVGSQVSGRLDKLFADFGSSVKKGQTIATIEPSFFRAAAAQARAGHASAKAALEKARAQEIQARRSFVRATSLLEGGLVAKSEYDAAEADLSVAVSGVAAAVANVTQAAAALEQASLNLHYTTIISPIDGTVISRNVDVGQTVAAALQAPTLFTIAQDLTRMQVDTNVAEADVGKVTSGMDVTFTVDAYPQRKFEGKVRQVRDNAQTIQNVVTYDAVIDVDNGEHLLKPGMTASVTFVYARRETALRVPNSALRFKADAATLAVMTSGQPKSDAKPEPERRPVWVLRDGRATLLSLRTGISDGTSTEVLDDQLREGDAVVVEANAPGAGK